MWTPEAVEDLFTPPCPSVAVVDTPQGPLRLVATLAMPWRPCEFTVGNQERLSAEQVAAVLNDSSNGR